MDPALVGIIIGILFTVVGGGWVIISTNRRELDQLRREQNDGRHALAHKVDIAIKELDVQFHGLDKRIVKLERNGKP